jgi:hypothetical protein
MLRQKSEKIFEDFKFEWWLLYSHDFIINWSSKYSKKHENVTRLSEKRSGKGRSERRCGGIKVWVSSFFCFYSTHFVLCRSLSDLTALNSRGFHYIHIYNFIKICTVRFLTFYFNMSFFFCFNKYSFVI